MRRVWLACACLGLGIVAVAVALATESAARPVDPWPLEQSSMVLRGGYFRQLAIAQLPGVSEFVHVCRVTQGDELRLAITGEDPNAFGKVAFDVPATGNPCFRLVSREGDVRNSGIKIRVADSSACPANGAPHRLVLTKWEADRYQWDEQRKEWRYFDHLSDIVNAPLGPQIQGPVKHWSWYSAAGDFTKEYPLLTTGFGIVVTSISFKLQGDEGSGNWVDELNLGDVPVREDIRWLYTPGHLTPDQAAE